MNLKLLVKCTKIIWAFEGFEDTFGDACIMAINLSYNRVLILEITVFIYRIYSYVLNYAILIYMFIFIFLDISSKGPIKMGDLLALNYIFNMLNAQHT